MQSVSKRSPCCVRAGSGAIPYLSFLMTGRFEMNLRFMTALILMASAAIAQTRDTRIQALRFWNDRELTDWALPVVLEYVEGPLSFCQIGNLRLPQTNSPKRISPPPRRITSAHCRFPYCGGVSSRVRIDAGRRPSQ